jgi:alkylated DNA nucleotide flippase Atl1
MVHAAETSLQKLLEGTKQYQVPLYQRTYQWGTDQLRRLWEDVAALAEDRGARGAAVTHFIGSLVLAPSPALGPTGVQGFLVVDGQQRLTTLTLLLCAIRDHRAAAENRQHFDRINEKYLINKWEDGAPAKLMPTQADRHSYLACVHATPQAGGDDAVGAAYRFFRARLLEQDDPDDPLDIQRVEEAVISGLSVVAVTAQHGDNAHRIFESLNNTGLRLTQGDLLRNYLFMRLPTRGEQVYRTLWLPLQELLSSDDLELLFWLDLVQRDETAKQSDTYALQQARLDRVGDEAAIEQEIARFAQLGRLLAAILDPTREPHPAVRAGLQRLDAWGTTTVYPILLHLLERRARGAADDAQVVAALSWLESYLVRRVVSGKATSNLNRILLRAVPEIAGRDPVDAALRTYLSTGRKFWASDAEIRQAARTVSYYWSGRAAQKALILRWLEESLGSKEPVTFKGLTLEHVLPQTPTAAWQTMLAEDLDDSEDPESVYQSLLHTIGNITLTGYNTKLSNSPFQTKRHELEHSALLMNQEIARNERWGRNEILARADILAGRIIDLWPGPDPSAIEELHDPTWSALLQVLAEIPAGRWTTYGDVAAVIGSHPVAVGTMLGSRPAPNPQRVLQSGGTVSPNFRWVDPDRTDDPHDVLAAEGVQFDATGKASPQQRISAGDLALLTGYVGNGDDETVLDNLPERPAKASIMEP